MPTRYSNVGNRAKPWQAKVQLCGETYWLGVYYTYEAAAKKEFEFKQNLRDITEQAHAMWKRQLIFQMAVAKVRENAAART